jgi:RNA polymerase sigma factor (sigma-70 family)
VRRGVVVSEYEGAFEGADPEVALLDLLRTYERPIIRYLQVMLADDDLALDCAQDTFLRAYRHLCSRRTITAGWLYTVARNRATDEFRRARRNAPSPEAIEHLSVDGWQEARGAEVRRVLAAMRAEDREVLHLHVFDGFSTEEIAEMLSIRPGAARMRLMRARERFRELWSRR